MKKNSNNHPPLAIADPTGPTADLQTETFSDGDPTGATGVGLQALNRFCFGHVCLDSLDPRKLLDAMSINWW